MHNIKDLQQKEIELLVASAKRCLNFIDHFGLLLEIYGSKESEEDKKSLTSKFNDTIYQIEEEDAYLYFLKLIGAKYTPGNNEDLSKKKEGFVPFLKVFDFIKENNIPLLPWSGFNQNAYIYSESIENNYLSLEEESINEITTEEGYAGSYYFDDLFKIVTSKMRLIPRSNEIFELLSLCLISEYMDKEYEFIELNSTKMDKKVIKDLFHKYYERLESDLKLKKPLNVESQEKCWSDLSFNMIQIQNQIISIRTKYLIPYQKLISDELVKVNVNREKLQRLFSEIKHFLFINNIDPQCWESSLDFPSITDMKKMTLGPTLLTKIQKGDGDQIKGFPKIREAFFEEIKLNKVIINENNIPQQTMGGASKKVS